jgi:lysylphosphatidylglycerol synthetase-like protein (DUF2156 family)
LISNLARSSDDPSGFFALSPRNQRFTVDGVAGLIAYRERGRHLIAFGGVHAPAAAQGVLLYGFLRYAQSRGRRVMFVQVRAAQTAMFVQRGFTVHQFGTSHSLELRRFSLRGSARMQLRNKLSRARKADLRVVEAGRDAPRDAATFRELRAVSGQWLRGKGKELDFMIARSADPMKPGGGSSWPLAATAQSRASSLMCRHGARLPATCTT